MIRSFDIQFLLMDSGLIAATCTIVESDKIYSYNDVGNSVFGAFRKVINQIKQTGRIHHIEPIISLSVAYQSL